MNKKGQTLTRQYSLISDYRDTTCYEIAVMEEPQGQGGSLALHNDVCVGDLLQGKTPINDFPMVDNAEHHSVLIAGGIGVTPIISMLRKLSIEKQSFEIHYAVRTHMDFALLDVIKELAGDKLHCYMSEEAGAKSLNLQDLLNAPNSNTHIYVCGPKGMIEAVRTISKATGWLAEQIHFESFGVKSLVEDKPISVYLSKSKKTIEVPANQSILDCLLKAGIDTPYQCKRGECSKCMTTVLSGTSEHRDLCLNDEQRKSSMCICVSRVIGDSLKLEL
jgi:vanillate O-demethylase ferredoxin subunit